MPNEISLTPISLDESKRLIELEKVIEAGQQTFIQVGDALAEIRDSRLYKSEHTTFEEYCRTKWGWTKQHCYRLIECAPIAKSNPRVTSINQARELAKVPKVEREAIIKTAVAKAKTEGRTLTAKDIKTAATPEPITTTVVVEDVEAQPEPNIKRIFQSATQSDKSAIRWWWTSAKPEKRGQFVRLLLTGSRPVHVEDKARFTELVMRWLAEDVSETEGAE
jgi:hypothetical protein